MTMLVLPSAGSAFLAESDAMLVDNAIATDFNA